MSSLWLDSVGLILDGTGAVVCDDCPCVSSVEVCGCSIPSSFNIKWVTASNGSCGSCIDILTDEYPVNYAGEVTCPFDATYHYWESADDIFGSPGLCSGIFDDKKLYVLVTGTGSNCTFVGRLRNVGAAPCSTFDFSSLQGDWSQLRSVPPLADVCSGPVVMTGGSWFNSSHCPQPTSLNLLI